MIGNIKIENEPIGSLPRPKELIKTINEFRDNKINKSVLDKECNCVIKETIKELVKSKQSVLTDGEQSKVSFIGYPIFGSNQFESDGHVFMDDKLKRKENSIDPNKYGVSIDFQDNHSRHIPVLSGKNLPFKYERYASDFVKEARAIIADDSKHYKQGIISPSALMLIYPSNPIQGYSRDQFISDLLNECEKDIRQCFQAGANYVQLDATELRLSLKLDPSAGLFNSMIELINSLLSRFNEQELKRIGIHECRGGDQLSPHSESVDITKVLLPNLFKLKLSRFYIEFAQESNRNEILKVVKDNIKPNQIVFFAVTKTCNQVESVNEIKELTNEILKVIPINQFGLTDTCGFSPFYDDQTLPREIAFNKMLNRELAAQSLSDELNNKK